MANYTYPVPPFSTTTFTSPLAGTNDVITTNSSDNFTINGNGGNDEVTTAGGDDTITTTTGNDVIIARNGNNSVSAGGGTNSVTTGSGNDTITTGSGADNINSGSGNDTITTGGGRDIVRSDGGADIIDSGAGSDRILAGAGDDTVNAGAGKDSILAGAGIDSLTGGGGHDTFVYVSLADAMLGADSISDFRTSPPRGAGNGDMLDLRNLVNDFSNLPSNITLDDLVASGHLSFSGTSGETVISFDSNGSAALGSAGILVSMTGVAFTSEMNSILAFNNNILVE